LSLALLLLGNIIFALVTSATFEAAEFEASASTTLEAVAFGVLFVL
jgi:hypothetical protein